MSPDAKMTYQIVSPQSELARGEAFNVTLPGTEGEAGIRAGHAPYLMTLNAGVVAISNNNKTISDQYFIEGGFADITATQCTILADSAINMNNLDVKSIDKDIAEAETAFQNSETEANKQLSFRKLEILQVKKRVAQKFVA